MPHRLGFNALALVLSVALCGLAVGEDAFEQGVRYFAVWSYMENAPSQEIPAEQRAGRRLGYWALSFDDQGGVSEGSYHGADGTAWLILKYVVVKDRVYADLYSADGTFQSRKSTRLSSLMPRWSGSR